MTKVILVIFVLVMINELTGQRNQRCLNSLGQNGVCTSILACVGSNFVTQDDVDLLRRSPCDGGDHLVCCVNTANTQSRNSGVSNLFPDRSTCGIQVGNKIFNGGATSLDEFPWMALLEYENGNGRRSYFCGGSLITSRYILTAAHCVTGSQFNSRMIKLVSARLGEYDVSTNPDCEGSNQFQSCNNPIDVPVEKVIPHENYNSDNKNKYNDIALVRLRNNVEFNDFVKPVCLPIANEDSPTGSLLIVAGWGATESARRSSVKMKVQLPKVDKQRCSRKFVEANIQLNNNQICAGGVDGKDSCQGDSGGPLMTRTFNDTSQWYIEGVVSFGNRCGEIGWPGIYTKVYNYMDWIKKNVVE